MTRLSYVATTTMKSTAIWCLLALLLVAPIVSAQWLFPDENSCRTPNQQLGKCTNIKNCPVMLELVKNNRTLQNVDYLRKSHCGYEGRDPKVCCERNDGEQQTPLPTQGPLTTNQEPPPNVEQHPNVRLLEVNCGIIHTPKIIGGQVTGIDEFPWMALLEYDVGKAKPEFRCGGSVISKRYILTAAHCVTDLPSNMRLSGIRVGEHDITTDIDCEGVGVDRECNPRHQDFEIEEVKFHPQYSRSTLHNDVALIRVDRDIDFSQRNAQAICMPLNIGNIIPNKLVVSGWGVTELRVSSPVMMKVRLSRFSQDECARVYQKQTKISRKQMCMGGEQGKDSCNGDSGGPLQSPLKIDGVRDRYVQYGIVSFGLKHCGTQNFPGVYTRVDYYLDWILNTIRP